MVLTLCKKVRGCVHPPNHLGACEVGRVPRAPVSKATIGGAVTFLDEQERIAQQAARLTDELLLVVGANKVLFEGGLNRQALVVLVTAKCKNASNGKPVSEATVELVMDALARLGEFINEPS